MKTIATENIPRRPGREFTLKCFLCPAPATVRRVMAEGAATVNACLCEDCNRLDDDHLTLRLNRRGIVRNAVDYIENRVQALTGRTICMYCGADLGSCDIPAGMVSHGCCRDCYQMELKKMGR